jgi:hypothetical protein
MGDVNAGGVVRETHRHAYAQVGTTVAVSAGLAGMILVLGLLGTQLLGFTGWNASSADGSRGTASIRFPAGRARPAVRLGPDDSGAGRTRPHATRAQASGRHGESSPVPARHAHRGRARHHRRPQAAKRRTTSERRTPSQGGIPGSAATPAPGNATVSAQPGAGAQSADSTRQASSEGRARPHPRPPGRGNTRQGRHGHSEPAERSGERGSSAPRGQAPARGTQSGPPGRSVQADHSGKAHDHPQHPAHAGGHQPSAPPAAPDAANGPPGPVATPAPSAPATGHEPGHGEGHARGVGRYVRSGLRY